MVNPMGNGYNVTYGLGCSVNRSRGAALAFLLALTTVILVLGATAVGLIAHLSQQVAKNERASQAKYAAKAGLSRALLELSKDPLWAPPTLLLPDGDPDGLPFRHDYLGSEIRVVNNWAGTAPIPAPDSTMVEPGRVWLECTGTLHGRALGGAHGVAAALAVKPEVVFDLACYQREGTLNIGPPSVLIASYRSTNAPNVPKVPVPATLSQATIRAEGGVMMNGASQLQGRVQVPRVDSEVSAHLAAPLVDVVPDGPLRLQFSEPEAFRALPHPSHGGPDLDLAPGPYLDIEVPAGGRLTLHGGTYYIDSLRLGENAVLAVETVTAASPCVVYLSG